MVQGQRWLNLLQIIFFGNYTGEIGMWCVNYLRKCKWVILLLLYRSKLTKTLLYQFKWCLISILFHFSLITWQRLLLLTFFRWQSLNYYFLTIFFIQFNSRIFWFNKWLLYNAWQNWWLLLLTELQNWILKTILLLRDILWLILYLRLLSRIPWCLLVNWH